MAMKSKVVIKDLCNPKKIIANMPDSTNSTVVGIVYGTATDINVRASADGLKTYEGLKGTFEAVPSDKAAEATQSSICYLPEFAQPLVSDMLKEVDEDGERVNHNVKFGFEVSIERATNPQGYSWALRALGNPVADDPLDKLRQEFAPALAAPKAVAQIEHKPGTAEQTATPKAAPASNVKPMAAAARK